MPTIKVRCPAKLNLCFDITGTRPDGYHDVETLFQSINLEDELHIEVSEAAAFTTEITCNNPFVKKQMPLDNSNLIGKAAALFFAELKSTKSYALTVSLEKNIPIGAGLAGGSGNAAGTLLALNRIFDQPFSETELITMSLGVGSDVPFFFQGGSAKGLGRGEILTPFTNALSLTFCIVKPSRLSILTPWAYSAFDNYRGRIQKPNLGKAISALEAGNLELALDSFGNVFEPVIFEAHPVLRELKKQLVDLGAWYCQMTGSGPTLFALVANREMAQQIRRHVLKDDDLGFSYWTDEILHEAIPPFNFQIAESSNHGVRII